jgi:hypothetical protein
MPNRDGSHYFLTALAPIHADPCEGAKGTITSPTAAVREALATLPTAAQSEACIDSGRTSPFARCHRTHMARLVVIDQPAFNGRTPGNTLIDAVRKTDLLAHGPVDALTRSWLLLAVDFDPGDGPAHGLHDYLVGLWGVMSEELRSVYSHCYGFDESVHDGDGFARYIIRCQVETTMPFNDYATTPTSLPTLPTTTMIVGAGLFIVAAGGLAGWAASGRGLGMIIGSVVLAMLVAAAIAVWAAYCFVVARGSKLFPAAPGTDLRTILKALYLQQHFTRFAIAQQGASPDDLHRAFGDFTRTHRLDDIAEPTQAPGVIRS